MSKKLERKYVLVPVQIEMESMYGWLEDEIIKYITPAAEKGIDDIGRNYSHDVTWRDDYCFKAKFYLHRVSIGAIGRLNTVRSTIRLALRSKCRVPSRCFTSTALYRVFCISRGFKKNAMHLLQLEEWLNSYQSGRSKNTRFIEIAQYLKD